MKPILEIKGISKRFRLDHQAAPYESLRERMGRLVRWSGSTDHEDFWALRDITFDVRQGESVGIIGRNGAGKSTLLKVLSRITPPTSGTVLSRGRIASLLEVGTGFHPELTGRENIFLNGSILGMKRTEIRNKFDAIVDFSGVERFLDTPLKHYSSGMQMRLAFSVAAFLEPEILVIDEVLAVGDAEFQRKCLGKMNEVAASGRTILFVSHHLGAIRSLCTTAVYLKDGSVAGYGPASDVLESYLRSQTVQTGNESAQLPSNCGRVRLKMPYWIGPDGNAVNEYLYGDRPRLRFELKVLQTIPGLVAGYAVRTRDGSRIFTSHSMDDPKAAWSEAVPGDYVLEADLDLPMLAPGTYEIPFGIKERSGQTLIFSDDRLQLTIGAAAREKDAQEGLLLHTGRWQLISKTENTTES